MPVAIGAGEEGSYNYLKQNHVQKARDCEREGTEEGRKEGGGDKDREGGREARINISLLLRTSSQVRRNMRQDARTERRDKEEERRRDSGTKEGRRRSQK